MQHKILLERTVLGMALEKNFARAKCFLSPINFSTNGEFSHRLIWQAMEKLYPAEPIDAISVSGYIQEQYQLSYHHYLCQLTSQVVSDYIEYHSLQLLELDIRGKLVQALMLEESKAAKDLNINLATIYHEMQNTASKHDIDLFVVTDSIQKYLKSYDTEVPKSISLLINTLPIRIVELKSNTQLKTLLQHLKDFQNNFSDNRASLLIEELCNHLEREI